MGWNIQGSQDRLRSTYANSGVNPAAAVPILRLRIFDAFADRALRWSVPLDEVGRAHSGGRAVAVFAGQLQLGR